MNIEKQKKILEYVKLSAVLVDHLAKQTTARDDQQKKIAAAIPAVVDALVKNKRLEETEREKAAQVLSDPIQALEVLKNTARHRNADELTIGKAAEPEKQAADHTRHYLGMRHDDSYVRESDRKFFERMGITLS